MLEVITTEPRNALTAIAVALYQKLQGWELSCPIHRGGQAIREHLHDGKWGGDAAIAAAAAEHRTDGVSPLIRCGAYRAASSTTASAKGDSDARTALSYYSFFMHKYLQYLHAQISYGICS